VERITRQRITVGRLQLVLVVVLFAGRGRAARVLCLRRKVLEICRNHLVAATALMAKILITICHRLTVIVDVTISIIVTTTTVIIIVVVVVIIIAVVVVVVGYILIGSGLLQMYGIIA
jgi:hypothetical protein